ncbi:MAG: hypothetical protein AAF478_02240 [Pseudomonadota bacterium]
MYGSLSHVCEDEGENMSKGMSWKRSLCAGLFAGSTVWVAGLVLGEHTPITAAISGGAGALVGIILGRKLFRSDLEKDEENA